MLRLDHLTVIAPSLIDGVDHIRACLGLDVPFGSRHDYMGTHNHRVKLGDAVYLEIVAFDPCGREPGRPRWFGLDDHRKIRDDWDAGRRLRGWVASTQAMDAVLATHGAIFGQAALLPSKNPTFSFTIPADGSLPLDGAAPSIIDHRGDSSYVTTIPDLGARLHSFILEHPDAATIQALYRELAIYNPPVVVQAEKTRYMALIETSSGLAELT